MNSSKSSMASFGLGSVCLLAGWWIAREHVADYVHVAILGGSIGYEFTDGCITADEVAIAWNLAVLIAC